jgi:hypothetical protein
MKYLLIIFFALGVDFALADTTYGKVVGVSSGLFVNLLQDDGSYLPSTIGSNTFLGTNARFVTDESSENVFEMDVGCGRMLPEIVGDTTGDFVLVVMVDGKVKHAIVPAGSHYEFSCGWRLSGNISLR